MCDHDDGLALFDQFFKNLQDGFSGDTVEVAGGLIGDDQVWVVDQGSGDGDALFLSA